MSPSGFPEKNLSRRQFLCERLENLKGPKALDMNCLSFIEKIKVQEFLQIKTTVRFIFY